MFFAFDKKLNGPYAGLFDLFGIGTGELYTFGDNNFAGYRRNRGLCEAEALYSFGECQFFVEFISADGGDVISLLVKEQILYQCDGGIHDGRIAGAELAVYLLERLITGVAARDLFGFLRHEILVKSRFYQFFVSEHLVNIAVFGETERTEQHGYRELAVFVDTDIEYIGRIGLVLKPCTAIRYDRRGEHPLACLVVGILKIDTGRTDELRYYDTLGTVYDERAAFGHLRDVAHINFLLLDLLGDLVCQSDCHLEGDSVVGVPFLAFGNRIFRRTVKRIADEIDDQVTRIIRHGRIILKYLRNAVFHKVLKRFFLDLDKIRHLKYFFVLCK